MFCLVFLNNINIFSIFLNSKKKNKFKKPFFIVNNSIIKKNNLINKKYLNVLFRIGTKYYFNFNYINNLKKLVFFKIINNFIHSNLNFTFMSSNDKFLLPYYNSVYSDENLTLYKNFIFYNVSYINFNNWLFFFKSFLKRFDVKILFVLDFINFSKFLKVYSKIDIIKIGLVDSSILELSFDFSFFINKFELSFYNVYFTNYFLIVFFENFNFTKYLLKKKYFTMLKNIVKKTQLLNS